MTVAEDLNPGEREPIHAVFVGRGGRLPARVRVLLDFLVEQVTQEVLDAERRRPGLPALTVPGAACDTRLVLATR